MLCLSFQQNEFNLTETCIDAKDNVLEELLEKRLWLFGQDLALNVYDLFLGYTLCIYQGISMTDSIAHLAHHEPWIVRTEICLTKLEKR